MNSSFDPDEYQAGLREPLAGDDAPAAITVAQATKCANVVSAAKAGHEGFSQALKDVAAFLHAAAMEGTGLVDVSPSAADLWEKLDKLPWGLPGGPRAQPDVN